MSKKIIRKESARWSAFCRARFRMMARAGAAGCRRGEKQSSGYALFVGCKMSEFFLFLFSFWAGYLACLWYSERPAKS
jgi:hypothetical protein